MSIIATHELGTRTATGKPRIESVPFRVTITRGDTADSYRADGSRCFDLAPGPYIIQISTSQPYDCPGSSDGPRGVWSFEVVVPEKGVEIVRLGCRMTRDA